MEATPQQVCEDILQLLARFKSEVAHIADAKRLTIAQIWAIFTINQHDGLAMGKVANVLHCDPSNVTGIVDRLVAQNIVRREECPTDRRAKMITLTDEGKRIHDEILAILPEQLGCTKLAGAERSALHSTVQKLLV
jgi:DNA-binding MarR family transcriptional regulator